MLHKIKKIKKVNAGRLRWFRRVEADDLLWQPVKGAAERERRDIYRLISLSHFLCVFREAEPVEDENSPMGENDEEEQEYEEEAEEESKLSESTGIFLGEEGSGGYEGSAAEGPYIADKSNLGETGSGMLWKESGGIFCRTGFAWIQ